MLFCEEFPAILLNTATGRIVSEFHQYVRPTRYPILTDFCKNLTGIAQSTVDSAETFPVVFGKFMKWLTEITINNDLRFATRNNGIGKNATFCSWSGWDIKDFLCRDCRNHNLKMPDELKVWIDVRYVFRVNQFFFIYF